MPRQREDAWTGAWVAKRMKAHSSVHQADAVSDHRVNIVPKKHPAFAAGTMAITRVDRGTIVDFVRLDPDVEFIVNVPKEVYVSGDAFEELCSRQIGFGGMGDLMRVVDGGNPRGYQNPEFAFVERGLAQHTRVASFRRLDERRYRIERKGLEAVVVVFLNDYDLSADRVRTAASWYGEFQAIVVTNPNGRASSLADAAAASMGCRILKWGQFLGDLNRPWA